MATAHAFFLGSSVVHLTEGGVSLATVNVERGDCLGVVLMKRQEKNQCSVSSVASFIDKMTTLISHVLWGVYY